MSEVFKDIKGFEGCYKISNFGRVLSLIGNLNIKGCLDWEEYTEEKSNG